jgi:hypothetical protein
VVPALENREARPGWQEHWGDTRRKQTGLRAVDKKDSQRETIIEGRCSKKAATPEYWWLIPVILATWEAEIRRIEV